jgi:hypothetical protein
MPSLTAATTIRERHHKADVARRCSVGGFTLCQCRNSCWGTGRSRPIAAIEAHRLSVRKGRFAVTDRRSDDPEEVTQSGRCEAISRRRFHPLGLQKFPVGNRPFATPWTQRRALR